MADAALPREATASPDAGSGAVMAASVPVRRAVPTFNEIYTTHFDFVWRSLRRLGVPPGAVADAVQDVFVVVHRRLAEFEGRASVKTWLFDIALRVASDHRRLLRRKGGLDALPDHLPDAAPGPDDALARAQALALLAKLLAELDADRRAVLVLAELEQMTAPEIAAELGINPRTVYTRLLAARQQFEALVARHRRRLR
jgi:RNA polymerase sigma-70 factor (ECF subfamily)